MEREAATRAELGLGEPASAEVFDDGLPARVRGVEGGMDEAPGWDMARRGNRRLLAGRFPYVVYRLSITHISGPP
jgi:hypothetical protein